MPILYGVTFPEPIQSLPRRCQGGIPGREGWDKWPGWSVQVKANRVYITQEPIDLTDENATGVAPAAKLEHEASEKGDKKILRLVYSVPASMAILHYVDTGDAKLMAEKAPSDAALKLLAERKANPPPPPKPAAPVPGAYAGPPVTPTRRPQPPASPRPVEPPPSEIVLEE